MNTYPAGKLPHAELGRLLAAYTHHHEQLLVPPTLGEDAAVIEFGDRLLVVKRIRSLSPPTRSAGTQST